MKLRVLDLFSGIGGFSLGLHWAGDFETVGFCEIEEYPRKVLELRFPGVPIFNDIRSLTGEQIKEQCGTVDVVCGGYPCQPFSLAGKRQGAKDDRHLWPEMFRIVQELKPTWVVGENVAGHINMGLDQVLSDLESEGYEVQSFVIPAVAVDAQHRRDRIWIISYNDGTGFQENGTKQQAKRFEQCGTPTNSNCTRSDRNTEHEVCTGWNPAESCFDFMAYATNTGVKSVRGGENTVCGCDALEDTKFIGGGTEKNSCETQRKKTNRSASWFSRPSWWPTEPNVGGTFNGLSSWLDRFGELNSEEKERSNQILQELRKIIGEEEIRKQAGRLQYVSESQVLLSLMCKYEEREVGRWVEVERKKACWEILRSVWGNIESSCSPLRSRYNKQLSRKLANSLRLLSCETPSQIRAAWKGGFWEDGTPRVADGISRRVDRLKCLGNAVVPQVVEVIGRAIMEVENGR